MSFSWWEPEQAGYVNSEKSPTLNRQFFEKTKNYPSLVHTTAPWHKKPKMLNQELVLIANNTLLPFFLIAHLPNQDLFGDG